VVVAVMVAEAVGAVVLITAKVVVYYAQFLKVTLVCVTLIYLFLSCICTVSVIGHLAVDAAHKNKIKI
jgi:hypothetical protein